MEKPLEDLSVSSLNNLLNAEIRQFIIALDHSSTDDLERMKLRLKEIYNLINVKEKAEMIPLKWGKNSTQPVANSQPDLTDGFLSNAQTA